MTEMGKENIFFEPAKDQGGLSEIDPRLLESMKAERVLYIDPKLTDLFDHLKNIPVYEKKEPSKIIEIQEKAIEDIKIFETIKLNDWRQFEGWTLERFRNPNPYELPGLLRGYESNNEVLLRARLERWGSHEKIYPFLRRVWVDNKYMWNRAALHGGFGVPMERYWDGKNMMLWQLDRTKFNPDMNIFEIVFTKNAPGLDIMSKAITKPELVREELKEGLREKAVKMQSDRMRWSMSVATVAQQDYLGDGAVEYLQRDIKPYEIDFIQKIFVSVDKHTGAEQWLIQTKDENGKDLTPARKIPKSILNYYSEDFSSEDIRRKYFVTMEALLVLGAKDKLDEIAGKHSSPLEIFNDTDYTGLIQKVKDYIKDSLSEYNNDFDINPNEDKLLARTIAEDGWVFDCGLMHACRMGWSYEWKLVTEKNQKGEEIQKLVRSIREGDMWAQTDHYNAINWFNYYLRWEEKFWPKGIMCPPSSSDYRDRKFGNEKKGMLAKPPNYVEKLDQKHLDEDPILGRAWKILHARLQEISTDKDIDDEVKGNLNKFIEYINKNTWIIETPFEYYNSKLGKNCKVYWPMFFPPNLESMSFLEAVSTKGEQKLAGGDPSIFDLLRDGVKQEDIKYTKLRVEAIERWQTTMQMFYRVLISIMDSKGESNEALINAFWEQISGEKESTKRLDLGGRDDKIAKIFLFMFVYPNCTALYLAGQHQLTSEQVNVGDDDLTDFLKDFSEYRRMSAYAPVIKDDFPLRKALVAFMDFYAPITLRLGRAWSEREFTEQQTAEQDLVEHVFQVTNFGGEDIKLQSRFIKQPINKTYKDPK